MSYFINPIRESLQLTWLQLQALIPACSPPS